MSPSVDCKLSTRAVNQVFWVKLWLQCRGRTLVYNLCLKWIKRVWSLHDFLYHQDQASPTLPLQAQEGWWRWTIRRLMHTPAPGHWSPTGDPFPTHLPGCGPAQTDYSCSSMENPSGRSRAGAREPFMLFNSSPADSPMAWARSAFHITVAEFLEEPAKTTPPHRHSFKLSIVAVYCSSSLSVGWCDRYLLVPLRVVELSVNVHNWCF